MTQPLVRTLAMDVPVDELGVILVHEHLHFAQDFLQRLRGDPTMNSVHFEDADLITAELIDARESGVSLIVDAGHDDMGRDLAFVQNVAERADIHVVLGGGYYLQRIYPEMLSRCSVEEISERMMRDAATQRWGVIGELGTSERITDDERRVLRAAAIVSQKTGLSILTHTEREGMAAIEQLDVLEQAGVDPAAVAIGHLGGQPDTRLHRQILKRGAYVAFDRVSREGFESDLRQARQVAELIGAGWLERILVSGDQGSRRDDLRASGGGGYAKAWTVFARVLEQVGLNDSEIQRLFVRNPLTLLELA